MMRSSERWFLFLRASCALRKQNSLGLPIAQSTAYSSSFWKALLVDAYRLICTKRVAMRLMTQNGILVYQARRN